MLAGLAALCIWVEPVLSGSMAYPTQSSIFSIQFLFILVPSPLRGEADVCRPLGFLLFLFRLPRAEVICARWVVAYMENRCSRVCWGVKGIFGLGFCLF